jgi:hypothetical protein
MTTIGAAAARQEPDQTMRVLAFRSTLRAGRRARG